AGTERAGVDAGQRRGRAPRYADARGTGGRGAEPDGVDVPIERVKGPDDPRLADYRWVSDPELVRRRGLFVAEGRLVVRRLIDDGRHILRSLLVSDAALESLTPAIARLDSTVPIYVCAVEEFVGVTGHTIHRGCLALAEPREAVAVDDLLASATRIVALEDVANPDN